MISGIWRYADLTAHVRALAGYLITAEQWQDLLELPDLPSLANTLSQLPYGREGSVPETPSLRSLEIAFSETLAREYEKFIGITQAKIRTLLRELWRRFELDNLKAILRHMAEARPVPIQDLIVPLHNSVLPLDRLSETSDLEAAASLLSGTVYGPPLADALPRYQSEGTLFPVEVALDLNYWRRVWRTVNKLRGADQQWATQLVGTRLDRLNITWAFRFRIYYNLSEEEIINYTLPYGYRSDDSVLRAIAGGAGLQEVVTKVWGTGIPEVEGLHEGEDRDWLRDFEVALARMECRMACKPFSGQGFHLGLLLAYLLRKECEAHDLTVLAESKAEELPADEIEPYLVSFGV